MTKGIVLNYGQAMKLADIEDKVELHVKYNYPDKYYGKPNNILGRAGREYSKTSWGKISKLAKNDEVLQSFVDEFNRELSKIKDEINKH